MWTCPQCGEKIESRFDTCWNCAPRSEEASVAEIPPPPPLKRSRYVFAMVVAYLIPWMALLLHAVLSWRRWSDYPAVFRHALLHQQFAELSSGALWALIPGAVTFLVLAPFLRFPVARRGLLLLLVLAWFHLASATDVRGAGDESAGSGGTFRNDTDRAWSVTAYAPPSRMSLLGLPISDPAL